MVFAIPAARHALSICVNVLTRQFPLAGFQLSIVGPDLVSQWAAALASMSDGVVASDEAAVASRRAYGLSPVSTTEYQQRATRIIRLRQRQISNRTWLRLQVRANGGWR